MNTLQERLRELAFCDGAHSSHIYDEAADRLDALEREVEALQSAATLLADELTRLRTENADLRATLKQAREYEALYHELIMLVGNKYPNETRHETAKRYIASVETRSGKTGSQAAIEKVQQ